MPITAKRTGGPSITVDYEFGANLDELIEAYGEDVVYAHAKGSLTVALQGWLRAQLDAEKTDKEIKAAAVDWKPGVRKQGKSPIEKMRDQLGKLSAEERAALVKEMRGGNEGSAAQAQTSRPAAAGKKR